MKNTILFITIFLFSSAVFAQNQIEVCESKTTHIICPEKVSYLQVGDHSRIIAEIVPEHPNLVRVKAVEPFEGESSLTIVCANKVYSLFVKYANSNDISYRLESFSFEKAGNTGSNILPEYLLKEYSYQILSKARKHIKTGSRKRMGLSSV